MKITRRVFVLFLLIVPLVLSVADRSAANRKYLVFVGTYTAKTESKGIYSFDFDADTGKLMPKGVAAETPDPSWVAVHPNGKYAYAANEAGKASTVSAFAVDSKSGKLTLLNQMSALGEDPCYLSFDRTGKYLLVANYSSGTVAVFPISVDGRLGEHTALVKDQGATGPNKERQDGPHAHWIEASENNRVVYVADLGLDRVLAYSFDPALGTLTPGSSAATMIPGAGPRHVTFWTFSSHRKFMYVLGELDSSVTVFAIDWEHPFDQMQQLSAKPDGFAGRNDAAEIAIDRRGKHLYTSNRGNDTIAVFEVFDDLQRRGRLGLIALIPTGGKEPRHFAIDPSGKYLLAENQLSNNIVIFKIDQKTGSLTPTGQIVEVPSPVDLTFVAAE